MQNTKQKYRSYNAEFKRNAIKDMQEHPLTNNWKNVTLLLNHIEKNRYVFLRVTGGIT